MESSKVGYWLQVGANVGILAGLVLVGLQIGQNSELTRLGFYSAEEDGYISMGGMVSGETLAQAWAKAIDDPEALTTGEMLQLEWFLENMWTQLSRRDYLFDEGIYEISGEEDISYDARRYFGNAFAQAWWLEKRKEMFDESWLLLRDAMDKALAEISQTDQADRFAAIRASIAARNAIKAVTRPTD